MALSTMILPAFFERMNTSRAQINIVLFCVSLNFHYLCGQNIKKEK